MITGINSSESSATFLLEDILPEKESIATDVEVQENYTATACRVRANNGLFTNFIIKVFIFINLFLIKFVSALQPNRMVSESHKHISAVVVEYKRSLCNYDKKTDENNFKIDRLSNLFYKVICSLSDSSILKLSEEKLIKMIKKQSVALFGERISSAEINHFINNNLYKPIIASHRLASLYDNEASKNMMSFFYNISVYGLLIVIIIRLLMLLIPLPKVRH